MQPRATSISDASPRRCPSTRGRPRALAQRPFPSISSATWRGTSSRGIAGGRAPDGCGAGGWNRGTSAPYGVGQLPRSAAGNDATADPPGGSRAPPRRSAHTWSGRWSHQFVQARGGPGRGARRSAGGCGWRNDRDAGESSSRSWLPRTSIDTIRTNTNPATSTMPTVRANQPSTACATPAIVRTLSPRALSSTKTTMINPMSARTDKPLLYSATSARGPVLPSLKLHRLQSTDPAHDGQRKERSGQRSGGTQNCRSHRFSADGDLRC